MINVSMYRETLDKLLDDLPVEKIVELIDFASYLKDRQQNSSSYSSEIVVKSVPIENLKRLAGTVAWGGDAISETERLYE